MGEIKSTLELVMERTRHLSLSPEEKDRQRRADFEKRLQGLLQSYADGAVAVEALLERMAALQAEYEVTDRRVPVAAVLGWIDPDGDRGPWWTLLARLAPEAARPVRKILKAHGNRHGKLYAEGLNRCRQRLARDHGIEGSAVAPNVQRDDRYAEGVSKLRRKTRAEIEGAAGSF
jgi:hypothetical protein